MKKLEKVLFVLFVSIFLGAVSLNAMTETELKNKLTASYTINGVKFQATADQITQVERYLNQNDISSADADYIAARVDSAIAVIEAGSAKSLKELTKGEKDRVIALVNEVSNNTQVKLTVGKGEITVFNTDGTTFTKITSANVRYTDSLNVIIISVAGIILLTGVILIGKKLTKKENA